jgi:hypothetical protein
LKDRTKRFHNNINAKTLKSLEELVTAIAAMHNIIKARMRRGNTNLTVPMNRSQNYLGLFLNAICKKLQKYG